MNDDILNSFAAFYLEKKVGITTKGEINHEMSFLEDLEVVIFRYVITDKDNFDRNERIKELYKSLTDFLNIEESNNKLLKTGLEKLLILEAAKLDLESTVSGKKTSESKVFENFPLKTTSTVEQEYKLDDLYDYINQQPPNIYSNPQSILTLVLAKRFIEKDELSRIKKNLKVEIPDETLESILSRIEDFIPFFIACKESKKTGILRDEEEIKAVIDFVKDKLDNQNNTLDNFKEELKRIDKEITNTLFDYLGKNPDEFRASNPALLEKAKSIGFILKRLQHPETMDKEILEELSGWFPSCLGLTEERISKVLCEWSLSKPDNIFIRSSERDLFPYKLSHLMLMQDDLFLQDLAQRELVKAMNEDRSYSINRVDATSTDMFSGDLQKLMEVVANFGKQLFKINTFISRESDKPNFREDITRKSSDIDVSKLELSELSRTIKKFKKDLEENLQKESQKEVSLKLLGVVDFFDNLFNSIPEGVSEEVKSIKESLDIIYSKLMRILAEYGLSVINCVGERFDPSFHECIDVQSSGSKEPNIIIREVIKGYKMGDEVIRFPKVIVSA